MFDVQFRGSFRGDGFVAWDEDGGLGAVVVCYSEDGIVTLGDWQFGDEVQCDGFEGQCVDFWGDGVTDAYIFAYS